MIVLSNDQREHLNFLLDKPPEIVQDFCKLATEHCTAGSNKKKYSHLGAKLNTTYEVIQNSVEALLYLLIDFSKSNASETEFKESFKQFGFKEDQLPVLYNFVSTKNNIIDGVMTRLSTANQRFIDLDWRLDVKVSSRSLLKQITPVIIIKVHLDTENKGENRATIIQEGNQSKISTKKQVLFQTDPNNLRQLIDSLEQALLTSRAIKV